MSTAVSLETTRLLRKHRLGSGGGRRDFDDPGLTAHYPPHLELEPEHLDIDLSVDLAQAQVSGTVTTRVRARRDGPRRLELDAVDFEAVAVSDPDGHPLTWQYDGQKLRITWQTPFAADETRRAAVTYRVVEPTSGLYFSKPDDAYPEQAWYAASDHETERARHWLPCIDLPNVRTRLDFHLRAESRFTILANGRLLSEETHPDGSKTAHWRLTQLCPSYLVCIAIGDFTQADDEAVQDGEQTIPLAYFSSRAHTPADLLRTFGRTGPMMRWLTQKLAMPFPYPKYYQFALPGLGGAMENISLVSWGDRLVQDEALAPEARWAIDQVNVHEMAHSYFGDAIVCRDFAHAWLKESWATYIEQVYLEDNGSREEADYVYYLNAKYYLEEAEQQYQRPIVTRRFKTSWDLYDAHLYEGGACRLHTLRSELGDETFWTAVRDYLQTYSGRVVETDDFRDVMEAHSGRSLGHFFDQWFRQKGFPDLKVDFNYEDEKKRGTFTIEQQQVDKEGRGPTFELLLEVGWVSAGELETLPVRMTEARHTVVVAMPQEPEMVRVDPAHKTLHKLTFDPGVKLLRRQLVDAADVIGRIQAAHTLAKSGKGRQIQAIVDAYAAEPFWGVRREMAAALGEAEHETAVAGLAHLLTVEQEPMVLNHLIRAAGRYRDGRIQEALLQRLDAGLPPVATQNVYQALGAQRQAAPWERLANAAAQPSFNGIVQGGAYLALGAARRTAAIPLLQAAAAYGGAPNRTRPAALIALAQLGRGLEEKRLREQIVEQCIDLLRDPWHEVRWAAARALRILRAPEAIGAVEAFGRALSTQERVAVERIASALRREDKVDGSAAKKQLEELQGKVRKLEATVEALSAQLNPANGNGKSDGG